MRKKKIASYFALIALLLALSVVTPLLIGNISGYIAERLRGGGAKEAQSEGAVKETGPDGEEMAVISGETLEGGSEKAPADRENAPASEKAAVRNTTTAPPLPEVSYYDEPVYKTPEEEDAANREAYLDMTKRLKSLSEAAEEYRKSFNPVYEELTAGIMSAFITGREGSFYADIADYCFGRYNTTKGIALVRFDAVTQDSEDKMTVILEIFSPDEMRDETRLPGLTYCTCFKKTGAFIFYESGG